MMKRCCTISPVYLIPLKCTIYNRVKLSPGLSKARPNTKRDTERDRRGVLIVQECKMKLRMLSNGANKRDNEHQRRTIWRGRGRCIDFPNNLWNVNCRWLRGRWEFHTNYCSSTESRIVYEIRFFVKKNFIWVEMKCSFCFNYRTICIKFSDLKFYGNSIEPTENYQKI